MQFRRMAIQLTISIPIFYEKASQYQGLVNSKEKRACNLVTINIQTEAKNSNKLCISSKSAKVTKNSTILLLF